MEKLEFAYKTRTSEQKKVFVHNPTWPAFYSSWSCVWSTSDLLWGRSAEKTKKEDGGHNNDACTSFKVRNHSQPHPVSALACNIIL